MHFLFCYSIFFQFIPLLWQLVCYDKKMIEFPSCAFLTIFHGKLTYKSFLFFSFFRFIFFGAFTTGNFTKPLLNQTSTLLSQLCMLCSSLTTENLQIERSTSQKALYVKQMYAFCCSKNINYCG